VPRLHPGVPQHSLGAQGVQRRRLAPRERSTTDELPFHWFEIGEQARNAATREIVESVGGVFLDVETMTSLRADAAHGQEQAGERGLHSLLRPWACGFLDQAPLPCLDRLAQVGCKASTLELPSVLSCVSYHITGTYYSLHTQYFLDRRGFLHVHHL